MLGSNPEQEVLDVMNREERTVSVMVLIALVLSLAFLVLD
jgi:hypothetical protein